jgi:hypothetical protein
MLLFHGTRQHDLRFLEPQFYGGANGSQDGVGINLTDSLTAAQGYGKGGRILLLSPATEAFLRIDEQTKLSPSQCEKMSGLFNDLPVELQLRFATDLHGKQKHSFTDENAAKAFYKTSKAEIAGFHLPDRIKPSVEFERETIDVIIARREADFSQVNTKHLHYILNLCDNKLATVLFKEITTGLVLPKDSGATHYLSFRKDEMVLADFSVEDTQHPGFHAQLKTLSSLTGPQWLQLHREHGSPAAVAQALQSTHRPNLDAAPTSEAIHRSHIENSHEQERRPGPR